MNDINEFKEAWNKSIFDVKHIHLIRRISFLADEYDIDKDNENVVIIGFQNYEVHVVQLKNIKSVK